MALLFELVSSVVVKPLLLAKLSCQFGARSLYFVVQTWLELLRFALTMHFVILWRLAIWIMALLSLSVRAFTALFRERLLERQLQRLKKEMETVILDYNVLEEQLHVAIKERAMLKMMLMELEQEHDDAILKIKLLQGEVQFLKEESQRLKEVWGKSVWNYLDEDGMMSNDSYINNTGKSTWRLPNQTITGICKNLMHDVVKLCGFTQPQPQNTVMVSKEGIVARQREAAFRQSLFSALLWVVVSMVAWEAEDRCMPLMIALLVVVMMSMVSALQLYRRVEHNKAEASDSVALLSINCFILGTIAHPMLPRFLAPLALKWISL